tara:strand:+ start:460 stop:636 length:177 start_codon:yes stop_codon:yes gene_type:complete
MTTEKKRTYRMVFSVEFDAYEHEIGTWVIGIEDELNDLIFPIETTNEQFRFAKVPWAQ